MESKLKSAPYKKSVQFQLFGTLNKPDHTLNGVHASRFYLIDFKEFHKVHKEDQWIVQQNELMLKQRDKFLY